ncbi:uncharacterized protein LOC133032015 [Cannabis sativa]|uniref:uncharacterized protein LOC133032015 n=1 Tax=Cannabis sativa TaxID=3483 RepID=UPI0029C9FFAF|nr:uncharacterized protein LOC133032015 [Cannabis sativa]
MQEKVAYCGEILAKWGNTITGDFKGRIAQSKSTLKRLKKLRDAHSRSLFSEEKKKLANIFHQKEVYWRQRSKQLWLKDGDRNSKYFQAFAIKRRNSNTIQKLKDDQGNWTDWNNGLHQVIFYYYSNIFQASLLDWHEIVDCITPFIAQLQNISLMEPVTMDEVKGLNDTNLVLIPKKKNPVGMGDLRPISLCNVLYKVISKMLANRLKGLLDHVISPFQSTFIPGRVISDNVLVSFEVFDYLKRKIKGKKGFMVLNLDMSKAYDCIEWAFLEAMRLKMGFNISWVALIVTSVSSVKYNVVHGGQRIEPIIPLCGIRQGDPLFVHSVC